MRRRDLTPHERFERSARFWARAYPRRWREIHGDELLAVQQDVAQAAAEATGAPVPDRLSVGEVRGLLRAGWGLRWRERPPLWRWVLYRFFDVRLPAKHWWWVADDIHGAAFAFRAQAGTVGMVTAFATLPTIVTFLSGQVPYIPLYLATWYWWAFMALTILVGGTAFRKDRVRRAWRRHVMEGNMPLPPRASVPLPPGVERPAPRFAPRAAGGSEPTS
ncbi:hypothetical protein [Oerskovia sp. Root22]|uniref:hypothetical protein n=1 Tax=Oerskovia sp. Root22 TaxID=1736494 RepID=UPI0006F790BB|nr:hypothetical protein [Oerskovia sp. Root22]KRC33150.1 hypothetical protein ASE15_16010 [Oerskovia sp. Root22]